MTRHIGFFEGLRILWRERHDVLRTKKDFLKEISFYMSEILSVSQKLLDLKTHQMDSLRHDDGVSGKDGYEEDSCGCCHLHGTPECRHHDDEPRSAEPSPADAGSHECCYADDGRCHVCRRREYRCFCGAKCDTNICECEENCWEKDDNPPKARSTEFPNCEACAPCALCDDECGCVPGPCAMCGHEKPLLEPLCDCGHGAICNCGCAAQTHVDSPPKADASASEAKREAASSDYVSTSPDPNKPHWCELCRIWTSRKHGHIRLPTSK